MAEYVPPRKQGMQSLDLYQVTIEKTDTDAFSFSWTWHVSNGARLFHDGGISMTRAGARWAARRAARKHARRPALPPPESFIYRPKEPRRG